MSEKPSAPVATGKPSAAQLKFAQLIAHHRDAGTRPGESGIVGKWTNKELARAIGKSERILNEYLNGNQTPPNITNFIEAFFGKDPDLARDCHDFISAFRITNGNEGRDYPFIDVPIRPSNFVGRQIEISKLKIILDSSSTAVIAQAGRASVHGLGGIGKSWLATEYAYRYKNLYHGVIWCRGENRSVLLSSLSKLAKIIIGATYEESDVIKSARDALNALKNNDNRWLFIYDNIIDPHSIIDLIPEGGVHLLITSRYSDWGHFAEEIPLQVLSLNESISFLVGRTGRNDENGAAALAEALGHLPLALDHAAAYCKLHLKSFKDYASDVESLIGEIPVSTMYPQNVSATFKIAISSVTQKSRSANGLMAFIAQCSPEPIPMKLLEIGFAKDKKFLDSIKILKQYSLIQEYVGEDGDVAIIVHRLVQAVARDNYSKIILKKSSHELERSLVAAFPKNVFDKPSEWSWCSFLVPHVIRMNGVRKKSSKGESSWSDLLYCTAGYFNAIGLPADAIPLAEEAYRNISANVADNSPSIPHGLALISTLHANAGNASIALSYIEKAISKSEVINGSTSIQHAFFMFSHALDLKDSDKSKKILNECSVIIEKNLGNDHPSLISVLLAQGNLHTQSQEYSTSSDFISRAKEICLLRLNNKHRQYPKILEVEAYLHLSKGDIRTARSILKEAFEISQEILGDNHPDTLKLATNLAEITP